MQLTEQWLTDRYGLLEEARPPAAVPAEAALAYGIFEEYASARGLKGRHDLLSYHQTEITDPFAQFDEIETTVNHLYRDPHPALAGKSYGAGFAEVLLQEGALGKRSRVLEVGCGTGLFGREFLRRIRQAAPELYRGLHYTFFDASPALSRFQRETNREHEAVVAFQTGDASAGGFPKAEYDLVISNEMIADLPVVKLTKGGPPAPGPEADAWALSRRLSLAFEDAPPQFILNVGALGFLEGISQTLRPGGRAFIVEYGSPHGYSVARPVTNHLEHSIHFGHLLRASTTLGLEAMLREVPEFLGFLGDLEVLDESCRLALFSHLLPFLGLEAELSRVYTPDLLLERLPGVCPRVRNLTYVPLRTQGGIAYPAGFFVLRLLKGS
jgi:SAM-dependent methyltransferase